MTFSDLCGDISFQSDTRLLGVLGTPGLKGQKGDIVSIWDEFGEVSKCLPNLSLPSLTQWILFDLSQGALKK